METALAIDKELGIMEKKKRMDLVNKTWPESSFEVKGDLAEFAKFYHQKVTPYLKSPFVSDGHVSLRALGKRSLSKPIVPGECAITSLVRGMDGRIFGATSGRRSHLFVYDPSPEADCVIDLGIIRENSSVWHSLVAYRDGRIFGGTLDEEGILFSYVPDNDFVNEFGYNKGNIETLETPVEKEGIVGLTVDLSRDCLYGLSNRSGTLFRYDITLRKIEKIGEIDSSNKFSFAITIDNDGKVYFAGNMNALLYFDPMKESIIKTGINIPTAKGVEEYSYIDSLAFDATRQMLYAGTREGFLSSINIRNFSSYPLGKPTTQLRTKVLSIGNDGRVYGISGDVGGMGHLFCYDPDKGTLRDLGILYAMVERQWHGYEFESVTTGKYGEIYLGESDRISNLFIYFPAIKVCPMGQN
ncbi:MAG: hypothetical protein M1371_05620 [Actinobacteria bacterium]|nr:hypothetical protein [Actinomycetota bacterium]